MRPIEEATFAYAKRYQRYVAMLAIIVVSLITLYTLLFTSHNRVAGIIPRHQIPPFAVPLAVGHLTGDANIATHANDGSAGRRPACTVRGPEILNLCQLYEEGPVVLALFIDTASCTQVLDYLQSLAPAFPGVRFAGVSIMGNRAQLRELIASHHLSLPIGYDHDGVLASLYGMVTCPQVTFIYPGGIAQSHPLLTGPTVGTLRSRVSELVAAARARGWRPERPAA
jgi:hypothetical protein